MSEDKHVWRTGRSGGKIPMTSPGEKKKCKICNQLVKSLPSGKLPEHSVPLDKKGKWHWCTDKPK